MPIRKFKHVDDMEDTLWYDRGDARLSIAIRRVWDFADRVAARRFPPGVYKHRSITDADAQREAWDDVNFRIAHARRLLSESAESDAQPKPGKE